MNSVVPRTIVGFEIAGRALRAAIVRSSLNRLRLLTAFVIEDFTTRSPEEQRAELDALARRHSLRGTPIFLALPREYGLVQQLDFPVEVKENLRSAVELQVESLSPWPIEDVYWDVASKGSAGPASMLRATLAIVPRAAVDAWMDLFASAGLPLSGVGLAVLAWGHAISRFWPDGLPTLVMDLEEEYAEGALVRGETIVSARAAEPKSSAERIRQIAIHLASVGRVPSLDTARVLAYGREADGLEADRPALPLEGARAESGKQFGAIAAALLGIGNSVFSTNLAPKERRYRRNQLQLIPTYALLALLVLAGVGLLVREPYQWASYGAALDREIVAVRPEAQDVTDQETELNTLSEKYRALTSHLDGRDRTLETLGELVRVLPVDTWLTTYALEGGSITISGFSASASELQRLVEESTLFENAEFSSSVVRDDAGRDRFTLRFSVEDAS